MDLFQDLAALDRPQFFNGQRLFADDLQGLEAVNREMRWLHNRSLHQPGIGNGYAVSGKKGDRVIATGPGYAIDSTGREILSTTTHISSVPPVAGAKDGSPTCFDLMISYPDDTAMAIVETRAGVCLPRGAVRRREEPIFCWVELRVNEEDGSLRAVDPVLEQAIDRGDMIAVARVEVLNCQLNKDVSVAMRRSARPARQPYIFAGRSRPHKWLPEKIGPSAGSPRRAQGNEATAASSRAAVSLPLGAIVLPVLMSGAIDTSQARFLTEPSYSARIAGPRPQVITSQDLGIAEARGQWAVFLDGLLNITDERPQGFIANVLPILLVPLGAPANIEAVAQRRTTGRSLSKLLEKSFQQWSIVWFGVEG